MRRYDGRWPRYVPVAERRATAEKQMAKLNKKGIATNPVRIAGRTITNTFWGKSWCQHLESFSDYANRLPRGRTYVRNGSVVDLQVTPGKIQAQVMGSYLYDISIEITAMAKAQWAELIQLCSGKIDSLIELLQGKFSKAVMTIITDTKQGLFPKPHEIKLSCSCPDWADMCKHVAAVLYGVGSTLDHKPEWLFVLRQVDHLELISQAAVSDTLTQPKGTETLAEDELSSIFGIDMSAGTTPAIQTPSEKLVSASKKAEIKPEKAAVKKQKTSAKKSNVPKAAVSRSSKSAKTKKPIVKTAAAKKTTNKTSATKTAQKKPSVASTKPIQKATKSAVKKTTSPVKKKKTAAKKSKTKAAAKVHL